MMMGRKIYWLGAALIFMMLLPRIGTAQSLQASLQYIEIEVYQPEIYLPYKADLVREAALRKSMNSLKEGNRPEEVLTLLGAPDEVEAIIVAGDRDDEFQGFIYRYLFDRRKSQEWGKAYDERQFSLQFDLSGHLIASASIGIPDFKEIVRVQGLDMAFCMGLHETVRINELLLRLDFVLDATNAASAESAITNEEQGAYALLTAEIGERKEDLRLHLMSEGQDTMPSILFGQYKITLMAITNAHSIRLLVE
jgi:hypothetical protein